MAMPVFPAAARSVAIPVPIMLQMLARIGSMFGSTGSIHGGTKMRAVFAPIWCTSYTISGCHLFSSAAVLRVSGCVKMYQSRLSSWPT